MCRISSSRLHLKAFKEIKKKCFVCWCSHTTSIRNHALCIRVFFWGGGRAVSTQNTVKTPWKAFHHFIYMESFCVGNTDTVWAVLGMLNENGFSELLRLCESSKRCIKFSMKKCNQTFRSGNGTFFWTFCINYGNAFRAIQTSSDN